MNLWVINQEGDLCQVTQILHPSKTVSNSYLRQVIVGYGTHGEKIILGYYKTEERCLKIFEKITNFLDLMNRLEIFKNDDSRFRLMTDLLINYNGKTIYEMPKE